RRVKRAAAPFDAACRRRKGKGALQARRGVAALVAKAGHGAAAVAAAQGIGKPRNTRELVGYGGRWCRRPGLSGTGFLTLDVGGRNTLLVDREDRLPRQAVEYEQKAHLARLNERRHHAAIGLLEVEQHRRRVGVEVPDIVVDDLVAPDHLAV